MTAKLPLYHQLLDLAYRLEIAMRRAEIHTDKISGSLYSHSPSGVEDYQLQQAVAIIDLNLFAGLTLKARNLLLTIISEMKMNNVFWLESAGAVAYRRLALAELKRENILLTTEQPRLYIINPFKLRRGKPLAAIMASLAHLSKENSILKLEDLRPPGKALMG